MPSKVTGPMRQKRYRERMHSMGLKQVSVWVPEGCVIELRRIAAKWEAEQIGRAHRENMRQARQRDLPLESADND